MFLATAPANPLSNGGGAVIIAIIGAVILLMMFMRHKIIGTIAVIIAFFAANGFHTGFPTQPTAGTWITAGIAFVFVYGIGLYLSKMLGGK